MHGELWGEAVEEMPGLLYEAEGAAGLPVPGFDWVVVVVGGQTPFVPLGKEGER